MTWHEESFILRMSLVTDHNTKSTIHISFNKQLRIILKYLFQLLCDEFLNVDSILEEVLTTLVMKSLQPHLKEGIIYRTNGNYCYHNLVLAFFSISFYRLLLGDCLGCQNGNEYKLD